MFVKGYILETHKVNALLGRRDNPEIPYNLQYVNWTVELVPPGAYKYLALVEDADKETQFVFVLLDGENEKELRDMPMPDVHPTLLDVANKVMTLGVWERRK
ncbi:hypothetical protein OG21DRAFT_239995 [Imleria badia]|jgi:hypothetical protein|nr:hypothetical protein OG21DRAFT_239995 [Imleria badia]